MFFIIILHIKEQKHCKYLWWFPSWQSNNLIHCGFCNSLGMPSPRTIIPQWCQFPTAMYLSARPPKWARMISPGWTDSTIAVSKIMQIVTERYQYAHKSTAKVTIRKVKLYCILCRKRDWLKREISEVFHLYFGLEETLPHSIIPLPATVLQLNNNTSHSVHKLTLMSMVSSQKIHCVIKS